jgi:hypothetical protein
MRQKLKDMGRFIAYNAALFPALLAIPILLFPILLDGRLPNDEEVNFFIIVSVVCFSIDRKFGPPKKMR